jgi:hypothetical protein
MLEFVLYLWLVNPLHRGEEMRPPSSLLTELWRPFYDWIPLRVPEARSRFEATARGSSGNNMVSLWG